MSAATAARHAPSTAPTQSRPRLQVVSAPVSARTRVPFIVACMAILVASLLCALVLNTSMAQGSYESHDLKITLARLSETEEQLRSDLELAQSPASLETAARALGMVPGPMPAAIRLADGTVIGTPTPAGTG